MGYVETVLQPGEAVRFKTHYHWVAFIPGSALLVLAVLSYWWSGRPNTWYGLWITLAVLLLAGRPSCSCAPATGRRTWCRARPAPRPPALVRTVVGERRDVRPGCDCVKGYGLAVSPHQDGEFSSGRDGGDVLLRRTRTRWKKASRMEFSEGTVWSVACFGRACSFRRSFGECGHDGSGGRAERR